MLKSKTLVPLPTKRITYKKANNGTKYVYYTVRSYRNHQGKPTSDEKSIGKLDPETGLLIPNKNFYQLFPEYLTEAGDYPKSVLHVGFLNSFYQVATSLELDSLLTAIFGERAQKILSLAAYMVAEGNVMQDYPDWIRQVSAQTTHYLSSQEISQFLITIQDEERIAFFERWSKQATENEYIAYDVTSISTYSTQIEKAEMGYNRDKEKLPQINLGMFYGETSRMPLFYSIYSGSLIDKVYLPYMMSLGQQIDLNNIRFVMDQGFVTQSNIEYMVTHHHRILSFLPKNLNIYKRVLDKHVRHTHSFKNWLADLEVYGYTLQAEMGDLPVTIYLYFDPAKAQFQEGNLFNSIKLEEKQLQTLQKQKQIKPSQHKYFSVDTTSVNVFTFELDYEKVDQIKQSFGYFALLSTDPDLSAEDALTIYRQKDVIEKSFDQLKNGMDYKRLRIHSQQAMDGKIFIAFIGLIIRSVMMKRLKEDESTSNFSMKKVIRELHKIEEVQLNNGETQRIPLTKMQKQILSVLGNK